MQTRTYAYDALGRLRSATTPEAGMVCFGTLSGSTCQANGYDDWGDLLYRTDARGVQTNYIYDGLNRLLGISYTNMPSGVSAMPNVCPTTGSSSNNANVCFTYGTSATNFNNGLLVSMTDATGSENYTYNNLEQVSQVHKTIGSTPYTTQYSYNLAGQLTQITYPSGRVVNENVDGIGRLSSVVGTLSGVNTTYASGFGYNTAFQVTGLQYGNNLYASYGFSADRLQLNCLDYSTTNRNGTCVHDSTSKFGLSYSYGSSGSNDGLIASTTDSVDNGRSATYTYDSLFRLTKTATAGSTNYPAWGLSETYDRYGNRSAQSIVSGCASINCPAPSVNVSATTNQIAGTGFRYDLSGNMTSDGQNTLTYDGENRIASASGPLGSASYSYDGNGLRVQKASPLNNPTTTTVYIFSGTKVIAEYVNGVGVGSPTREYVYSGSTLLAKIEGGATQYYHGDHLSVRMMTDSSGTKMGEQGHFPFGESWYTNNTTTKWGFTTYERDSETNNDYAMARYNVSRMARFSSPDPLGGSLGDPQSLNRYTYGRDLPVGMVDPLGLGPWPPCNTVQKRPSNISDESSGAHGPNALEGELDPSAEGFPPQDPCNPVGGGGRDDLLLGSDNFAELLIENLLSSYFIFDGSSIVPVGGPDGVPNILYPIGPWLFCDPRLDPTCVDGWCDPGIDINCDSLSRPAVTTEFLISRGDRPPVRCAGKARVVGPGKLTNGRPGGAFNVVVSAGTAAIVPSQFGLTKSQLSPFISQIEGFIGTNAKSPTFIGVTDVIGPPAGQANLLAKFPGLFVVELEGGSDMNIQHIVLRIPEGLSTQMSGGCPTGTSQIP